jgi:hypothetical protein
MLQPQAVSMNRYSLCRRKDGIVNTYVCKGRLAAASGCLYTSLWTTPGEYHGRDVSEKP